MSRRIVQIEEVHLLSPHKWRIQLCEGGRRWECDLTDPASIHSECSRENLEWVLESFPRRYPYESAKAATIFESILQYAESLDRQLLMSEKLRESHFGSSELASGAPIVADEDEAPEVIVLEVKAARTGSTFQAMLWESLSILSGAQVSAYMYVVRRVVQTPHGAEFPDLQPLRLADPVPGPKLLTRSTFNILFVVSRPNEDDDIDPQLVCGGAIEILAQLPPEESAKINLEVAMPGTWDAFQKHITNRTKEWHDQGGTGPWFDLVHFDVHGIVEDSRPFLKFLSKSGTKELRQNSNRIGELLCANHISTVFMNSCESAKVTGHEGSNLAEILLGYGVSTVVAMQFPLTTTGAMVFITSFYSVYLGSGFDILDAVDFARLMLLAKPSRSANLGVQVNLPDFIIPVVYRKSNLGNQIPATSLTALPSPSDGAIERAKQLIFIKQQHSRFGPFLGRNYDVMKLEWMLLNPKGSNVVLMTGIRGCGKTMLGIWLLAWWCHTGLCEAFWRWSYNINWSQSDFLAWLRDLYDDSSPDYPQKRDDIVTRLRVRREVFLIDSLDFVFHPNGAGHHSVTINDRTYLKDFVQRLKGGKTIVILTSNSPETWLGLPTKCVFQLQGLSFSHSYQLVLATLNQLGHASLLNDPQKSKYIEYMIYRLHFNPAAIIAVIKGMIAREGPNPKAAFDDLLLSWVRPDYSLLQVQECAAFVRRILTTVKSDPAKTLVVLGLSAPTNAYSSTFYEFIATAVNDLSPSDQPVTREWVVLFIEQNFLGSGWIARLSAGLTGGAGGEEYFLVHPILTNTVRMFLDASQYRSDIIESNIDMQTFGRWQQVLFQAFYRHLGDRAAGELLVANSLETKVNSLNYLSAMNSFSRNFQVYTSEPELALLACTYVLSITVQLWRHVSASQASHLPVDLLLEHADLAIRLFEDFPQSDLHVQKAFATFYSELCKHLSLYYLLKQSAKAQDYIKKSLIVAAKVLRQTDQIDGFPVENWYDHLITLGYAYLERDYTLKFSQAKASFLASFMMYRAVHNQVPVDTLQNLSYYLFFIRVCDLLSRASASMGESRAIPGKFLALGQRIATENSIDLGAYASAYESARVEDDENILPVLALPWNSENHELRMEDVYKILLKTSLLIEAGFTDSAKDELVKLLRKAILTGDEGAEFGCQSKLALLYFGQQDWHTAEKHAMRAMEVYPMGKNASGRWILSTMWETRILWLKFALIFIKVGKWELAIFAFQFLNENPRVVAREKTNIQALQIASAFESPEVFISEARSAATHGLLLLHSAPTYLISGHEFTELTKAFHPWFVATIKDVWPDFDMSSVNSSDLRLKLSFIPDGYSMEDHPSIFELDQMLLVYHKSVSEGIYVDDGTKRIIAGALQKSISSLAGVEMAKRQQSNVDNRGGIAAAAAAAATSETELDRPIEAASVADILRLSHDNFVQEALDLGLDLVPIISWERMHRVIRKWVEDSSPPGRSTAQSRIILQLLETIYEQGKQGNSIICPSNEAFADVIDLLLAKDLYETDEDGDRLESVLRLSAPELVSESASSAA